MAFELPDLPYRYDALEPVMSRETLEYHHDKHHRAYVTKTNQLVRGTQYEKASLEDIIKQASGPLYNNAAQVWNHTFFFECLRTPGTAAPGRVLAAVLKKSFGSTAGFKKKFTEAATELFGSGWVWLAAGRDGALEIIAGKDAENPLTQGLTALLACDVWEHAYYLDTRNERPKYLEGFWKLVNWKFVEENLAAASGARPGKRPAIALSDGARAHA